jgi:hypothetical protein
MCLNTYTDDEIYDILKSCDVYVVIRNPYERIINSTIAHHSSDNLSFLEFVKTNNEWDFKYFTPLIEKIVKNLNPTILNFENLTIQLNELRLKYNIDVLIDGQKETKWITSFNYSKPIYELQLIEFINECPHYKYFYNQYIINKIYNIFKEDFELFNIDINIDDLYPNIEI